MKGSSIDFSPSEKQQIGMEPLFEENPIIMVCPFCRKDITTTISYHAGTLCWFLCGLTIFLGLWIGCCVIPFYVNAVKDVVHSCPDCWQHLGRYNRL